MLGNYQYMCIEFVHITLIYAQTFTVWEVIVMSALVLEEAIHHVSCTPLTTVLGAKNVRLCPSVLFPQSVSEGCMPSKQP